MFEWLVNPLLKFIMASGTAEVLPRTTVMLTLDHYSSDDDDSMHGVEAVCQLYSPHLGWTRLMRLRSANHGFIG